MDTGRPTWIATLDRALLSYGRFLVVLVGLVSVGAAPWVASRIALFGVPLVLAAAVLFWHEPERGRVRWRAPAWFVVAFLVGVVLFSLGLRLLPSTSSPVPLGYDYGFYETAFQTYEGSPRDSDVPAWIRFQFEPGLLLLHQTLHHVAGLSAAVHLRFLWPLLGALVAVPLFTTTRAFLGDAPALVASGFYAASYTQFAVHEFLYEKNVVALMMFLVLARCARAEHWVAAGLVLGALGIWHRPTFLLSAFALAVFAAVDVVRTRRWTEWVGTGALAAAIFLPLWILRRQDYFGLGVGVIRTAGEGVGSAVPEGGTFIDFFAYQNAAITYLPLALAGVVLCLRLGRALLVAITFLVAYLDVAFRFVFYNRFIIMLDLVGLGLVGAAFFALVPSRRPWMRPAVLALLLLLAAVPTVQEATRPPGPPHVWIDAAQYEGMLWLRDHAEQDAGVLASNLDAPYVLAATDRRTHGPGLFDDPQNASDWRAFFETEDTDRVRAHLAAYPMPLYVYHADGHGPGLGTAKFREPLFTLVHEAGGARIWRYNG